jgi:hypothetical protein
VNGRPRTLAAALGAGLAALFALGAIAGAQEGVPAELREVGWWTDRPGATAAAEGGFEVAAGIDSSEQSVAALRFHFDAGSVTAFDVILTEAASLGTQFGGLKVCTTGAFWQGANPGPRDQAPEPDCSAEVRLTRSTSGAWLGSLAALAAGGGEVSLMVLPVYEPPVPVGPGMVVQIAGVEIAAAEGTPTTTTTTTTTTTIPVGAVGDGTTGSPPVGGDPAANYFEVPGSPAPTGEAAPPTEPAADATAGGDGEEEFFTLGPLEDDAGERRPWIRVLVLVPLSAGLGAGVVYARRFLNERGITLAG